MKTTSYSLAACFVCRSWAAAALTSAVLSAVLLGGVSARATNYYWTNALSDDYSDPAAWSPAGGPPNGAGAVAYTTNNASITYGAADNYQVLQLQLGALNNNPGGSFTMNGGSLVLDDNASDQGGLSLGGVYGTAGAGNTVGSSGTFVLNGGSVLVLRNTSTFYQDAADVGSDTNCTGTLTINGGVWTNLCNMQIGYWGNGAVNITGGALIESSGLLYVGDGGGAKSITASGTLNLSGGALYILRNVNHEPNGGSSDGGLGINRECTNGTVNISGGALYCSRIGTGFGTVVSTASESLNICGGDLYIGFAGVTNINSGGTHQNTQVNISGGTFHTVDLVMQTNTSLTSGLIAPGDTNATILADGTNWAWGASLPVNLTNNSFQVVEPAGTFTGPGYVTFAPDANRTITLNNQWSGTGGFVVNGPGTVISANNGLQNVGGAVTVSNGTLVVNGSLTNVPGSGLTVETGGTLALSTNTAATGIGSLITSNVTINGTLDYKLNTATTAGGGVNDLLVVTNLTLGGGSALNITPLQTPTVGSPYVVAQYSGTLSGTFAEVTTNGVSVGDSMTVSYANNEITLTVNSAATIVPTGPYNWISGSEQDYSVAADWDTGFVPTNVLDDELFTNGVACDYSAGDTNTAGPMVLGPWDNSSGAFNMSGGSLTLTNPANAYTLSLGGWDGASGGSSTGAGLSGINGVGSFTMSGGSLTVTRQGSGYYNQDGFMIGMDTNSSGTFSLNGGVANILCGLEVGVNGSGTLNVNGGVLVDNGWFHVGQGNGAAGACGSGAFTLSDGAVYILPNQGGSTAGASNGGLTINNSVTNAVVNISGGSLYCYRIGFDGGAGIIPSTGSTDTLNISGGTIYVGAGGVSSNSTAASQVQSVNISGGTFRTADMLFVGGGPGVNGDTNSILSDGTNWTWAVNPPVNLENSPGPGVVTFAPEAGRTITLDNAWSGPGNLNFAGPGTVATVGNITCSSVTISGGSFMDESLHFNVPLVVIAGGATFNLSAAGSVTLSSPLVVSNNTSTAILVGTINSGTATANMTYASGTPAWSINGTLTLASATTLSINNTGAPLTAGSYLLVSTNTATSVVNGTVPASFTLGGAGLAPGTAASLSIIGGQLYLVVTPLPQPVFTRIGVNGTTLTLAATNFVSGGVVNSTFVLLESTNLLLPAAQWTPVLTNIFDGNGVLNLSTNVVSPGVPTEFYMLEY